MRLSMDEVRKQHDGIKKLYEQGLRGATASVEQVLDLFDTIEALQQENEQLHELAKAKADGRLVVLPCKTEDTVFIVYAKKILETTVDKRAWTDDDGYMLRTKEEWFKEKDIGKTVFLSREEAEKALEVNDDWHSFTGAGHQLKLSGSRVGQGS